MLRRVGRSRRGAPAFSQIAPIYDQVMASVPYDEWLAYVHDLHGRWGQPRPGQRVLDLACGTGTIALALAAEGASVVGMDLSAGMLAEARAKQRAAGLAGCTWVQADMGRLGLAPGCFDLAVCLFDSLNYLLEPADFAAALRAVAASLVPGGLFMFDLNTPYALEEELFTQEDPRGWYGVPLRWRSRWNPRTRQTAVQMRFWPTSGSIHETHRQRAYETEEVEAMVVAAGLRRLALHEAYTHRDPGPETGRVFWVTTPADRGPGDGDA